MLREDKPLHRWLPKMDAESIRGRVDHHLTRQPTTSTAIDLPLSGAARRVLKYAADEAERLANQHIGTEHLLLGLLDEKSCVAAKILLEAGADAAALRTYHAGESQRPKPWSFQRASYHDWGFRAISGETVEIHGAGWNVDYVRDVIQFCRDYNWHWHKTAWKPRDVALHRKSGAVSFDLGLAADTSEFELVSGGWKKDHCLVCHWELFESEGEHGLGYTNGHDWLCVECYQRFWLRPDFFSSSQSEMS